MRNLWLAIAVLLAGIFFVSVPGYAASNSYVGKVITLQEGQGTVACFHKSKAAMGIIAYGVGNNDILRELMSDEECIPLIYGALKDGGDISFKILSSEKAPFIKDDTYITYLKIKILEPVELADLWIADLTCQWSETLTQCE